MLLAPNLNVFTIVMFAVAGCAFVAILLFLGYDKYIKPKKKNKAVQQVQKTETATTEKPEAEKPSENSQTPKKFCSNCGKEVADDVNFCPNCGTKIE